MILYFVGKQLNVIGLVVELLSGRRYLAEYSYVDFGYFYM
jgi:hypothetical protein